MGKNKKTNGDIVNKRAAKIQKTTTPTPPTPPTTTTEKNPLLIKTRRAIANNGTLGKLPVTLLSGFLGAGKTTLLQRILRNTLGMRCAVLVNDMASINVDANIAKKINRDIVEFENGCICCTLREELLEEIARMAKNKDIDYLVIEATGISEPLQVAETFTFDKPEIGIASLSDHAMLDTCVTVVDLFTFWSNWNSEATVLEQDAQQGNLPFGATDVEEVIETDERNIVDLLTDQIEFADVILLNKVDLVTSSQIDMIKMIVKKLNPKAKLFETIRSRVRLDEVINTGTFSLKDATQARGWLQEQRLGQHVPETLEYGIGSFVYRKQRAFHPQRIKEFFDRYFLVVELVEPDVPTTAQSGETTTITPARVATGKERNMRMHREIGNVLRSKGIFWISHEHALQAEWSQVGVMLTISPGEPWFSALSPEAWPEKDREKILKNIDNTQSYELVGDRRQEIVFIGVNLRKEEIYSKLNACLLTDQEQDKVHDALNSLDDYASDSSRQVLRNVYKQNPWEMWLIDTSYGKDDGGDDDGYMINMKRIRK